MLIPWAAVLTVVSGSDYSRTIYVDPERGNDTENCVEEPSYEAPCKSLSYAFQTQYRRSSTSYSLQPGTHYLDSTNASDTPFTALTDIAITGNSSSPSFVKILCSTDNTGLSFFRVQNITLGRFTMTNCSSREKGTSKNISDSAGFELLFITTALYFSHCTNISMESVIVANSPNASGLTVYNTIGTNTFTRCEFTNNLGPVNSSSFSGGGGVYIEFSYCIPGNTSCQSGSQPSYTNSNSNSVYVFTDCNFTNNSAIFSGTDNELSFISRRQVHVSFGLGGGLSIFFCGNATGNSVLISESTFSQNSAWFGGGLYVEFTDTSEGNSVSVVGSAFSDNICPESSRGGGVNIASFVSDDHTNLTENSVSITGCNFTQNRALKGGGLRMVATQQVFNLSLSGVRFDTNKGWFGGAVLIQMKDISLAEKRPSVLIQNCTFTRNTVNSYKYTGPHEVGMGIVYVESIDVKFDGKNVFENNLGSGLTLVEASAKVTNTTMIFVNNSAVNGGALALLGSAKLLVNNQTYILLDSNRALSMGGAIFNKYTERNTYIFTTNCFVVHEDGSLQPDEWGAHFVFRDNYDLMGENVIQTTSALSCDVTEMRNLSSVFCWKNWTYEYNGIQSHDCSQYIRTAPGHIVVHSNNSDNDNVFVVTAYPGEVTQIPISIFDDLNHTSAAVFSAIGKSDNSSTTKLARLDPDYSYIFSSKIRVLGTPNHSLQVNLDSIGDRRWHVRFVVNLTACPPGLSLLPVPVLLNNVSNSSLQYSESGEYWELEEEGEVDGSKACGCVSSDDSFQSLRCNSPTNAALLRGYWMGLETVHDQEVYVVSPCPSGFCLTARHEYISLPEDPNSLDKHICGIYNRKGRVCGECVDDYGPAINSGSFECVLCNISRHQLALHATYYVLSVYVPLFLLFLAIIVFNIKLTTGPANSFILFSQVISSTLNINADNRIPFNSISPNFDRYLKAYKFPYGIFNLQFFEIFVPEESRCFGTHLNALDLLLLEYLVAVSPLVMILAIVGVYRITGRCNWCSTCLCNRLCCYSNSRNRRICEESSDKLRKSTVPAIASFILLSYTKFSLTSSLIMAPAFIHTLGGEKAPQVYFYFAAQYRFDTPENILRYILPATLVFVTFVAVPPLLLLDYPLRLLERVLRLSPLLWRLYPSCKIHILLDAFQGCYKDRYRWFAGLYFIFRLLINATNASFDDLEQFFFQEFYCIVLALLVLLFRPYRRQFYLLNYFDCLIFLNLAVINLITLFLFVDTRRGANASVLLFSVQYILVFLPLVYMLVYVVWRLLPIPRVRTRVREWLENRRHTHKMENLIQNKSNTDSSSETPDDVDWERAKIINRYRPLRSPEGPLHSSVSRPTWNDSAATHPNPPSSSSTSEKGRVSGKDYGGTGRSDSGVSSTPASSMCPDDPLEHNT